MILIEKGKLKFLLAGRPIQVDVRREYRKGRVYPVGRPDKSEPICRVIILDVFRVDGAWRLTIRQHALEPPLFLSADPGGDRSDYTHMPHKGALGEPEVIDPEALERYTAQARETDEARKKATQAAKSRAARVKELEHAAENGDQQAKRHLFVIDQKIEAHERRIPRSQNG